MRKLAIASVLVLMVVAPSFAALDQRGLLCPACKVIIDYGAVGAAASGLQSACGDSNFRRCVGAAANLAVISAKACDTEVFMFTHNVPISQAQFDRMNKLWKDSCDRAVLMNRWRAQMLHGAKVNEDDVERLLNLWADEMQRVPREVAEGKVPR